MQYNQTRGDLNIMQQKPMISLIVTAYNRKEYILEALNSVLGQTLENKFFEVIIIKNYADPAIDKFIEENGFKSIISEGIEGTFYNLAFEKASVDIITFLDDDDILAENRLETILKVFQDNNIGYHHNNFEAFKEGEIIKNRIIGSSKYKSFRITNKDIRYVFSLDRKQLYVNNSSICPEGGVDPPFKGSKRTGRKYRSLFIYMCIAIRFRSLF